MAEAGVKVYYGNLMMLPDVARVLACLHEKDVRVELLDINKGRHPVPAEFFKLQASTRVPGPAFYDGTKVLFESRAICRHVSEKYADQGNRHLLGRDLLERSSIEQWLKSEENSFDPPSWTLVFNLAFAPSLNLKPDISQMEHNERKLSEVLDVYEQRLGESKYLAGNDFSLADLAHLPHSHYLANSSEWSYLFTRRKNVHKWWKRISERESWKKAATFLDTIPADSKRPPSSVTKASSRKAAAPHVEKVETSHTSLPPPPADSIVEPPRLEPQLPPLEPDLPMERELLPPHTASFHKAAAPPFVTISIEETGEESTVEKVEASPTSLAPPADTVVEPSRLEPQLPPAEPDEHASPPPAVERELLPPTAPPSWALFHKAAPPPAVMLSIQETGKEATVEKVETSLTSLAPPVDTIIEPSRLEPQLPPASPPPPTEREVLSAPPTPAATLSIQEAGKEATVEKVETSHTSLAPPADTIVEPSRLGPQLPPVELDDHASSPSPAPPSEASKPPQKLLSEEPKPPRTSATTESASPTVLTGAIPATHPARMLASRRPKPSETPPETNPVVNPITKPDESFSSNLNNTAAAEPHPPSDTTGPNPPTAGPDPTREPDEPSPPTPGDATGEIPAPSTVPPPDPSIVEAKSVVPSVLPTPASPSDSSDLPKSSATTETGARDSAPSLGPTPESEATVAPIIPSSSPTEPSDPPSPPPSPSN